MPGLDLSVVVRRYSFVFWRWRFPRVSGARGKVLGGGPVRYRPSGGRLRGRWAAAVFSGFFSGVFRGGL